MDKMRNYLPSSSLSDIGAYILSGPRINSSTNNLLGCLCFFCAAAVIVLVPAARRLPLGPLDALLSCKSLRAASRLSSLTLFRVRRCCFFDGGSSSSASSTWYRRSCELEESHAVVSRGRLGLRGKPCKSSVTPADTLWGLCSCSSSISSSSNSSTTGDSRSGHGQS
jgi:hypothetical protein